MYRTPEYYSIIKHTAMSDSKFSEVAVTKASVLLEAAANPSPCRVLSHGFSVAAIGLANLGFDVTVSTSHSVIGEDMSWHGLAWEPRSIAELSVAGDVYDMVLSLDQGTTYAVTSSAQQESVKHLSRVSRSGKLVTTLRDYKNMKASERRFDEPFVLGLGDGEAIFLTQRTWDVHDRQAWSESVFIIDQKQQLTVVGPTHRRTMYFKQLAKFLHDNGVKNYVVHKQPMYKSVFSKSFEYIITAEF